MIAHSLLSDCRFRARRAGCARRERNYLRPGLFAVLLLCCIARAATLDQVAASKDRCLQRLERAERLMDDLRRAVERIEGAGGGSAQGDEARLMGQLEQARSHVEHLRVRADNAWNRLDNIEGELAQSQGACSQCLTTSVELFCTQVERLEADAADNLRRLREIERGMRPLGHGGDRADSAAIAADSTANVASDSAAPDTSARTLSGDHAWRIAAGVDFSHLGDISHVDTTDVAATDSIIALLESPLTAYTRAVFTWRPARGRLRLLAPAVYIANHRASARLRSDIALAGDALVLSMEGGGEKRLARDTDSTTGETGDDEWVGTSSDPLDRLFADAVLTAGTMHRDGPVRFEIPVRLSLQSYRRHLRGYSSYRLYGTTPRLCLYKAGAPREARLALRLEYRDYFAPSGFVEHGGLDSLDVFRAEPALDLSLSAGAIRGDGRIAYLYEGYTSRGSPSRRHTVLSDVRMRGRVGERGEVTLEGEYACYREDHTRNVSAPYIQYIEYDTTFIGVIPVDTVFDTAQMAWEHRLDGQRWAMELRAEMEAGERLRGGIAVGYRGGNYDTDALDSLIRTATESPAADSTVHMSARDFIDEDHHELRPGLTLSYRGPRLTAHIDVRYRSEHIPSREWYTITANRGLSALADLTWTITPALSFYCMIEYDLKYYLGARGRVSTNAFVSSALTARF